MPWDWQTWGRKAGSCNEAAGFQSLPAASLNISVWAINGIAVSEKAPFEGQRPGSLGGVPSVAS